MGKAAKTISFDKCVLMQLEAHSKGCGTSVSNIVNMLVRNKVMGVDGFFREMAREHWLEFQRYQYLRDEAANKIKIEVLE